MDKGLNGISVRRIAIIVLLGGALCALVYSAPAFMTREKKPVPGTLLNTGGTSTAELIMENGWQTAYRMQKRLAGQKDIEVEYQSTGSTEGLNGLIDGKFAIAFTHAPLTDEQKKKAKDKGGELVQVPVVFCSVVPIYKLGALKKVRDASNLASAVGQAGGLPGLWPAGWVAETMVETPRLKFSAEVLADIFLGKIKRWNDPALQKLNEGVMLPDTEITVVHREDSSGTTFLFTDYLAGGSSAWKEKHGSAHAKVDWGVGVGKNRSFELVRHVKETEGAIGYVDLVYAAFSGVGYGSVQNKDKTAFIKAEASKMTAAAEQELPKIRADLSFTLTNKPGKDSYPICGAIWAVCYQKQPTGTRKEVVDFLQWVTHKGQDLTSKIYAPLPKELVKRVEEKIESIRAD